MTDTITTETPVTPTTVETPAVTPTVETPIVATVLNEVPKVEEAVPTVTPVVEASKTETPPEVKPTEVKVEEKAQSEEPAPAPVYDPFKLPENVQLDEVGVKGFTDILSELETKGKAEHALVQEFGQKAVDLYINEMNKTVTKLQEFYTQAWDKQKTDWKDDFLKDSEIGSNRAQTTVDAANSFIRTHGGTPEQQKEFRQLMDVSGLGNNKIMLRILANANRTMSEGEPLVASQPAPQIKSKVETLYGKSK